MDSRRQKMATQAARQHGLITAGQLQRLGFSDNQRRHLVASGALRPLRPGVNTLPGMPPTWEQAMLAAVLAAGPGAVLSHGSAGALWQLAHCPRHSPDPAHDPNPICLSAPRQLRMSDIVGCHRTLPRSSLREYRRVPVTSPEQTIIDLAATLSDTQLGECIDDAVRRRLLRLDRLHHLVLAASGPGRRLIQPVRRALAERGVGYDPGANAWEQTMDRQWDDAGLPASVRQYTVHVNGHTYRIDRAIVEYKIGIEWNGYATHGSRSGFDHDSDRRADLTAAGWHMLDFTPRSSPKRICHAVLAAVAQRQTNWMPQKPDTPDAPPPE